MLKPDVKAKWLAALRSGEYEQGTNYLKNDNKFCCLGVLCELHRKEFGDGDWKTMQSGPSSYLDRISTAPEEVEDWLGVEVTDREFEFKDKMEDIINLNDRVQLDFNEIANILEKQL